MKLNSILITGGHPTPAIACIDFIKSISPNTEISFVGRRYINPQEKNDTFEYQEVATARNIKFFHSTALRGLNGLIHIIPSLRQSFSIINEVRPDKILAFGGYISVPICIAAIIKGIPFYLHEQTSKPGNANRFLGIFAKSVFVSFKESISDFYQLPWDKEKIIFTGNPIRSEFFIAQAMPDFLANVGTPILFVNGGNMGSHAINQHIFNIVPKLLLNMTVVHQVGNVSEFGDWDIAEGIRNDASANNKHKYIPVRHLKSPNMASVLQASSLVLSRGGANTFFEIVASRKPAIIVPLPYSARGEQESQAQLLADYGVAEIFEQDQSSSLLLERIMTIVKSLKCYEKAYESLSKYTKPDAAKNIWEVMVSS